MRSFDHRDFDLQRLLALKGATTVAAAIPAHDESTTIGRTVDVLADLALAGLLDEVVVVDDGSSDATSEVAAASGARVVATGSVDGPGHGKGEALWTSLAVTESELVLWSDGDIVDFGPRFVLGLLGPLLLEPAIQFVKGHGHGSSEDPEAGGRITELVARPVIALAHRSLLAFRQPLSGEYGGRRDLLESLPFVRGYGVDLALLIDVVASVGLDHVAEVDLGIRTHRHRPLDTLRSTALEVLHAGLTRAGVTLPAEPPAAMPSDPSPRLDERPPVRLWRKP